MAAIVCITNKELLEEHGEMNKTIYFKTTNEAFDWVREYKIEDGVVVQIFKVGDFLWQAIGRENGKP